MCGHIGIFLPTLFHFDLSFSLATSRTYRMNPIGTGGFRERWFYDTSTRIEGFALAMRAPTRFRV